MSDQILETQSPETPNNSPQSPEASPAPEQVATSPSPAADPAAQPSLAEKIAAKRGSVINPIEAQKAAAIQQAYNPNFKFKAAGKEHEIPEFLRGVIKDKDSEKFIHDVFEKAYGLPALKARFTEMRSEHEQLRSTYGQVMGQVEEARQAYSKGDLSTMFEIFRVDPDKVLQWAVTQVQLQQLPPEQRHAYEARREAEKRAYMLERQNQQMGQETMQQQSQYLSQMLDLVLERQDYQAAAQAYDARKNQPGSFRSLVARVGAMEYSSTGKTLTPLQAVQQTLDLLGGMPTAATQAAQAAPAPATQATQPQAKKTIPNLSQASARGNAAPGKGKVKSIDDLKKAYDAIRQQS